MSTLDTKLDAPEDDCPQAVSARVSGNGRRTSASTYFANRHDDLLDWSPSSNAVDWVESPHEAADGIGMLRDARILIVDDCTLYRDYLAAVIESHGATPPGVAWDIPSLMGAFERMLPRIVLVNMATRDSRSILRHAMRLGAHVRVVVLGVPEDDESEIVACAEAGVAGYHLRTESLANLLITINKVAAGESICSPRVSAILLRRLSALAAQRQPVDRELVLTAREIQILRLLELGMGNREIAEQLCIAVHTVKNHVHSLLTKLGVSTRAQAAALARTILTDLPGD